ncbi:hypothetical protein [Paenibacillus phytorum]|uniref:hypothetical protein n=1 Tax=Paenibacillus phytorum TaxID=2654977 RepID=UPI001492852C|nr:hypothetical protein [Paenibacillus phytorum]
MLFPSIAEGRRTIVKELASRQLLYLFIQVTGSRAGYDPGGRAWYAQLNALSYG